MWKRLSSFVVLTVSGVVASSGVVLASTYFLTTNLDTSNKAQEAVVYDSNSVTIKELKPKGLSVTQAGNPGDHYGNTDTSSTGQVRAIAWGDMNCDGVTDLAIGAPGWDNSYFRASDAGQVYVYLGGPDLLEHYQAGQFDRAYASTVANNQLGYWTYFKDYDGDGIGELVMESLSGSIITSQWPECSQ